MAEINWDCEADTQLTANNLAQLVQPGDVICLEGDLGAGKTTFTRYFARALGISRRIKSPTFTLIREYDQGRLPLYHIDAYRLEDTGSEGLGLEEYLDGDGVTVIEWPQFIKDSLAPGYLWIRIEKTGDKSRHLTLLPSGERGEELGRALAQAETGRRKNEKGRD